MYKIEVEGSLYAVKRKRPTSLVKNADGAVAFLNEVERRADFEQLKQDPVIANKLLGIIDTLFASHLNGLIISPWIVCLSIKRLSVLKPVVS